MNILSSVSGTIVTEYNQVYSYSGDEFTGMTTEVAFRDHANGLLGAGQKNCLFLLVGVDRGALHMTIEVHDARPPVDDKWEEVVEASCTIVGPPDCLESWDGSNQPAARAKQ